MSGEMRPASCTCEVPDEELDDVTRSLAAAVFLCINLNGPVTGMCDRGMAAGTVTAAAVFAQRMGRPRGQIREMLDEAIEVAMREVDRIILADSATHEGSDAVN